MPRKIRRSIRNAGSATINFGKWAPKAAQHFFKEIPPETHRLRSWVVTYRGGLTMLCLLGVVLIPLLINNEFLFGLFMTADIMVIFAASWDFLAGCVGQVSFGHAAFLGIGGYFTAGLVQGIGLKWGTPWWISVFIGALAAVLFSLIVGIPCLRLRGPYLALGTLAFSLLLLYAFLYIPELYREQGIAGLHTLSYNPITGTSSIAVDYLVTLLFMLSSLVILIVIARSRTGTVFKSIRDDEVSAEASGINTTKYKLVAFMISAFFAGIAGSLFAMRLRSVSPPLFSSLYSFQAIIIAALGGVGTIFGAAGGAYIFVFLDQLLTILGFQDVSMLAAATILIILFRFASHGIVNPLVDRLKEFVQLLRGK
jgi:branched-chain amino acid transport system permease protein